MSDPTADAGHVFDQTNGLADGLEGESDGSAAGEERSAADRDAEDGSVGRDGLVEDDRSGAEDVDDPAS